MPDHGILKSFAKKTGKPKADIKKEWDSIKESFLDQGLNPKDPDFYPMLVRRLKESLGLKEELILLDKFKKYL